MYNNIRDFINVLEREGELVRITCEVDPLLEIAEITERISKSEMGGKALLFENTGTDFPVLTNMMGSSRRMALALGVGSLDDLAHRISSLLASVTSPKNGFGDKLRMLPLLGEMSRWMPRQSAGRGECQQVVLRGEQARLSLLPILQCREGDAGRFVTLPMVNTLDPETGVRNVGMYRMQVFDDHTTGMHWHIHKTGERHYRGYQKAGRRMPVTVCLGGDPAYTYAATAPMPDNMDEYLLAGFIRRRAVKLVKSLTNNIYIPSDCDFVIEGYVDPAEAKVMEGPFGDHTGFYSLEDMYPLFHVEAITYRRAAIYPATIVGIPPQEDAYISVATEKIFLEPIRFALQPEVRDLYMPWQGVSHNIAVVNIEKSYVGQPFKVACALWGAGQMMFNKMMMVCSVEQNIRDVQVLSGLLRGVSVKRDIVVSQGVLDVLDHTTATCGCGGKIAIDTTVVLLPELLCETIVAAQIVPCCGVEAIDTSLVGVWSTLLFFASPEVEVDAAAFMDKNDISGVNFVLVVDNSMSRLTHSEILWLVAGNCDPARDVVVCGDMLIVDGRSKVEANKVAKGIYPVRWPNVVTTDHSTIVLVDSRWTQYGVGEMIVSPSLRYIPLLFGDKAQK